jgi:hypothetical protein
MEWIEHKGKRILYSSYKGLEGERFVERIKKNEAKVLELVAQGHTDLLRLTDVTDSVVGGSADVMGQMRKTQEKVKPYTKANAVVGIDGIKKYLLNFLNSLPGFETRAFNTLEEAKDWLVAHD